MFCSSPRLRSLELCGALEHIIPNYDPLPVSSDKLEVVWLGYVPIQFVRWLLKAIIPQQAGLTLALDKVWEPMSVGLNVPFSVLNRVEPLYIRSREAMECNLDVSELVKNSPCM